MNICYFTSTKNIPPRDAVYLSGFRQNGAKIIECKDASPSWRKFVALYKKHRLIKNDYDIIFVGYSAYILVPFARLISRKRVVFNALASLYEGIILSRKQYGFCGLRAFYCLLIDFIAFHSASLTLVETNKQKEYLKKKYFLPGRKLMRALTGADEDKFFYDPGVKKLSDFTILFRGALLPESGVEYAIKAAHLLKNRGVKLRVIGNGMMAKKTGEFIKNYDLKNVEWISERLTDEDLRVKMQECHLSLGQLSDHDRLNRTIPHKAFETMATKLPHLTARNKAVMELFKENETCFCCNPADAEDLAKKILEIKNNPELTSKIADNAYQLYLQELTPQKLAQDLIVNLKKMFRI